jgi:hypothetical protein
VQYEEGVGRYGNQKKVSNDDLTEYVSVPFSGTEGSNYFSNTQYIGKVEWYETETEGEVVVEETMPGESDEEKYTAHTGPFVAGESYTAAVTLGARNGWTFNGVTKNFFTHKWATDVTYDANTGIVTVSFPPSYPGSFSGEKDGDVNSAIDLIREAAATADSFPARAGAIYDAGEDTLTLLLSKGPTKGEKVSFDTSKDLSEEGLVLSTVEYGYGYGHVYAYVYADGSIDNYYNYPCYTTDSSNGTLDRSATSPKKVVIDGGGRTVDLTGMPTDHPLITVGKGVELTLRNITFKGMKAGESGDDKNNTAPLINVSGGHLIIEKGAVITGNTSRYRFTGGGVYSIAGKITMTGGEISGNIAHDGGGVFVDGNSTFDMSGEAIISGNEVTEEGGGVFVRRGSKFDMSGGAKISGNEAVGGGGVFVSGYDYDYGYGHSEFTMSGDAIISGNEALYGGGVYSDDIFIKTGGVIYGNDGGKTDNTATSGSGHAACAMINFKKRNSTAGEGVCLDSSNDENWEEWEDLDDWDF